MTINPTRAGRRAALALLATSLVLVAMPAHADAADDAVSFFRAVGVDNARTVKNLLAAGFDPNTVDPKGQRPLYLTMRDESFQVAELLLPHPALLVDAANPADETALMMAALKGRLEWVQRLLDKGAGVAARPRRAD